MFPSNDSSEKSNDYELIKKLKRIPSFNDGKQLSLLNKQILESYADAKLDESPARLMVVLETMLLINIAYINDKSLVKDFGDLKNRFELLSVNNDYVDRSFNTDLFAFESSLLSYVTPIISPYRESSDQNIDMKTFISESDL